MDCRFIVQVLHERLARRQALAQQRAADNQEVSANMNKFLIKFYKEIIPPSNTPSSIQMM